MDYNTNAFITALTSDFTTADVQEKARPGGASDAHVGVHLAQSVTDGGEVTAEVLHHVLDAAGVFEQVDALSVRVVVHREGTFDGLGEVPEEEKMQEVRAASFKSAI